jgi:acyl-coenzyme A thioesterase PaaI-like protein
MRGSALVADEALNPGTDGRAAEMAGLADVVRRLIAATVLNRAEAAEVAEIASELGALADRLEAHIPDPPPPVTNVGARGPMVDGSTMAERMAFDVVIGRYSPLALPVEISFEPHRAIGRAEFTAPYEGPPGCVHGAVIAATFDIVLTAANIINQTPGLTVSLTTKYHLPTLLHEVARFEAWVARVDEKRVYTHGQIVQRDAITVEAEGVFARVDRHRTRTIAHTRRESGGNRPNGSP